MSVALFLLLGCDPGLPECREGTTLEADGHCYPPLLELPPRFDDAIENLPDCEPIDGGEDDVIDLARGCASEACANDTFNDMREALGDDVDCETASFDDRQVYCTWEDLGVDGLFPDDDRNEEPDPGRRTERVHLFPPYRGSTVDGVGVGANPACFFDSLGHPESLLLIDVGGEMMIRDLGYDQYGLLAFDLGDDDDSGLPNGYVDNLYLFGSP